MHFQDIISLISNISLTLTFLIGLVFGIAQVRIAERDRRERLTLDTIKNFQTREFAELLQLVNATDFPKNQDEINKLPVDQQTMIIQLSQQMESLGILVAKDLIDIDLVDRTLGSFVTTAWNKYKIMFSEMRERDPFLGEYFQWLAQQIYARVKSPTRKPYYLEEKE